MSLIHKVLIILVVLFTSIFAETDFTKPIDYGCGVYLFSNCFRDDFGISLSHWLYQHPDFKIKAVCECGKENGENRFIVGYWVIIEKP